MSVTFSSIKHISLGNARMTIFNVTGPALYTTGGETLTVAQQKTVMHGFDAATMDWTKVLYQSCKPGSTTTPAGLIADIDRTNGKMMFFRLDGGAASDLAGEVASTTDLHAQTVTCMMIYDVANG